MLYQLSPTVYSVSLDGSYKLRDAINKTFQNLNFPLALLYCTFHKRDLFHMLIDLLQYQE